MRHFLSQWRGMGRAVLMVLSSLLLVLYPLAVWLGLTWGGMRWLVWFLALVFITRLFILRVRSQGKGATGQMLWLGIALALAGALLCVVSGILKNYQLLLYYPVAMNVLLLALFGASLFSSSSLVERLARLRDPDLTPQAVIYTRRVTQVWCLFFILNGSIAMWTCLQEDMQVWALYNGLISYVLIGLLMGAEWLVRRRVQRQIKDKEVSS